MLFEKIKILSSFFTRKGEPVYFDLVRDCLYACIGTAVALFLYSCKKMVEVDPPINSITTEGAFSSDATASAAVVGIYSKLINTNGTPQFGSGGTTIYLGLSADELTKAGISGAPLQFSTNTILSDNPLVLSQLWSPAYFAVFDANSCIEGLSKSTGVSSSVKNQLMGECKFLRAFTYFYLTNLWGDVPMPLTSDWSQSYLLDRVPRVKVYEQIIADLKDAQNALPADYSIAADEKIRANKFAATALLARVYLYRQEWAKAEAESSSIINSSVYTLNDNLNEVFLKNSSEAILQFQPSKTFFPFAVIEQNALTAMPIYYLRSSFVNAFEPLDQRKTSWTKSAISGGSPVLHPFKYKVSQASSSGNMPEYYIVLL